MLTRRIPHCVDTGKSQGKTCTVWHDKREAEKLSGSDIVYAYVEDDVLHTRRAFATDIIRTKSTPTPRDLLGAMLKTP